MDGGTGEAEHIFFVANVNVNDGKLKVNVYWDDVEWFRRCRFGGVRK